MTNQQFDTQNPPFDAQQQQADPLAVGYVPRQQTEIDPMLSKHLDSSEQLTRLKNLLMGLDYDEDEDEWKPVMVTIGYEENGDEIKVEEGPLMEPKDVRMTIGYLEMFLNSNTFLSKLEDDDINEIMWNANKKLAVLFYNLRHKISPTTRDFIWGMIEAPIFLGLKRATSKITLDAVSKMQHSVEHIQANPQQQNTPEKEFKVLGW